MAPKEIGPRLTVEEVDALPDGTRLWVEWFGGNSGVWETMHKWNLPYIQYRNKINGFLSRPVDLHFFGVEDIRHHAHQILAD